MQFSALFCSIKPRILGDKLSHFAVIGGAGFIGSHFVDELAQTGHKITVIDNYCSGSLRHLSRHIGSSYLNIIECAAEDTGAVADALQGVNVVIHLASNPDIAKAATEPRIDFSQGTALTESVLEASRISGVKTFLYASGSGVYASSGLEPILEDTLLQPISTYGASKLAGEALMSSYSFMFSMKCLAFRFANVVGARQTHGVGFDFINNLKKNPYELKVLGNGSQTKSYIHVSDVVSGVLHALEHSDSSYDVFNVASLDYLTVKEIAKMSLEAMSLTNTKVSYGESDRGWKADVPKIFLDSSKLRGLGWKANYKSSEAMKVALESLV